MKHHARVVTERTREIGLRGRRRVTKPHLSQFVIEAITLALVGGIIGMAMGIAVGAIAASSSPTSGFFVPIWALALSHSASRPSDSSSASTPPPGLAPRPPESLRYGSSRRPAGFVGLGYPLFLMWETWEGSMPRVDL
jgi:putative ABC transport system permease protein